MGGAGSSPPFGLHKDLILASCFICKIRMPPQVPHVLREQEGLARDFSPLLPGPHVLQGLAEKGAERPLAKEPAPRAGTRARPVGLGVCGSSASYRPAAALRVGLESNFSLWLCNRNKLLQACYTIRTNQHSCSNKSRILCGFEPSPTPPFSEKKRRLHCYLFIVQSWSF